MQSAEHQVKHTFQHDCPPNAPNQSTLSHIHRALPRRVGRVLANRYRLDKLLGRGAMGEVYCAWDLHRHKQCAVKLVLTGASISLHAHQRLEQEARVIARLDHPNIIEVFDFGKEILDNMQFLVMELLDGVDLQSILRPGAPLPLGYALDIVRSVGNAVHYAHQQGIVHRDINPNNIFLAQQMGASGQLVAVIKVLDFGIAKFAAAAKGHGDEDGHPLTQDLLIGTLPYMPPEAGGSQPDRYGPHGDQWSLAVVTYQLLTGNLPFSRGNAYQLFHSICNDQPPSVQSLVPEIPAQISHAVEKAMSKSRLDRFDSVQDFVAALDSVAQKDVGTQTLPAISAAMLMQSCALPCTPSPRRRSTPDAATLTQTAHDREEGTRYGQPSLVAETVAEHEPPPLEGQPTMQIRLDLLGPLLETSRSQEDAVPTELPRQEEVVTAPHSYSQSMASISGERSSHLLSLAEGTVEETPKPRPVPRARLQRISKPELLSDPARRWVGSSTESNLVPVPPAQQTETARIEPSHIELSRIEPSHIEPSRIEPSRIEPSRIELAYHEPTRREQPTTLPTGLRAAVSDFRRQAPTWPGRPLPAPSPTQDVGCQATQLEMNEAHTVPSVSSAPAPSPADQSPTLNQVVTMIWRLLTTTARSTTSRILRKGSTSPRWTRWAAVVLLLGTGILGGAKLLRKPAQPVVTSLPPPRVERQAVPEKAAVHEADERQGEATSAAPANLAKSKKPLSSGGKGAGKPPATPATTPARPSASAKAPLEAAGGR